MSDELAQLRDIHLPSPIGWWPIAVGWYAVGLIILGVLLALAYFIYRNYKNGRAKRKALKLLQRYKDEYAQNNDTQLISSSLSELLKRVALVYFAREQVACLKGNELIDFFNKSSRNIDFESIKEMLLEMPYKPSNGANLRPLFLATEKWIKQRRGRCLN